MRTFLWGVLGQKGPSEIRKSKKKHIGLTNQKSPKNQNLQNRPRPMGSWALAHIGPWAPGPFGSIWAQKSEKMAPSGAETNSIKESQRSKMRSSQMLAGRTPLSD